MKSVHLIILLFFYGSSVAWAQSVPNGVVVDAKGKRIGRLLGENQVILRVQKRNILAFFKQPGFNVFYEASGELKGFFKTVDCSGPLFFMDQAEPEDDGGGWIPDSMLPSVYDVPNTGILVGGDPSPIDKRFYSSLTIFVPKLPFQQIQYQSYRFYADDVHPSECIQGSGTANLLETDAININGFTPPFRVK
jgi:hypothetical protein